MHIRVRRPFGRTFLPLEAMALAVLAGCSSSPQDHSGATDGGVGMDALAEAIPSRDAKPSTDTSSAGDSPNGDAATGTMIKWAPGFYILPYTQDQPNSPLSNFQPALNDAVAGKPTIQGVGVFTTWAGLEWKTEANWQFGGGASSTFVIDEIASFCRTNGLKLALIINPDVFNSGTPSAPMLNGDNGNVPYYLLTDPTTYGPGLYGNSGVASTGASGFWVQQTGGFCANFENANVQARLIAMLQHLGAVFDADPVLEAVILGPHPPRA